MKAFKEIVIISGKGGTGKTTVAASLANVMKDKVIVDADVDAANMYLLLKPDRTDGADFKGMPVAEINADICTSCGKCEELCRFDAIESAGHHYRVDPMSCESCGLCKIACPVDAVQMKEQIVGKWFISDTSMGDFVHARLIPGAENSGSLVTMVKFQARLKATEKKIKTILIDGPPGIGCPVTAAITGTDLAVLVTEPSYSGISDLERAYALADHFGIKCGVVINRFDINMDNTRLIENFASKKGLKVYAKIPHSRCIMEEISKANLPTANCPELATQIQNIHTHIQQALT